MNLFAYGTLIYPQIWQQVVGRDFRRLPGVLTGFEVYRAKGELFPVMIAGDSAAEVRGIVYCGLDAPSVARIDQYESGFYERRTVTVQLDQGGDAFCETYVLADQYRSLCSEEIWTSAWFEREALGEYLARFA